MGVTGVGVCIPSLSSENLTVFAESGETGSDEGAGVFNRKTRGRGVSPDRRGFVEKDLGMGRISTLERGPAAGGRETWDEPADEVREKEEISGKASKMDP